MFVPALNNAQFMHRLTSGVEDSKHAYVQKADILNSRCGNLCRQRNSIPCDHLL